jgi:hypothetical protein
MRLTPYVTNTFTEFTADNWVLAAKFLWQLWKNSTVLFATAKCIMGASEVPTYAMRISRTLKFNHCVWIKYKRSYVIPKAQMKAV